MFGTLFLNSVYMVWLIMGNCCTRRLRIPGCSGSVMWRLDDRWGHLHTGLPLLKYMPEWKHLMISFLNVCCAENTMCVGSFKITLHPPFKLFTCDYLTMYILTIDIHVGRWVQFCDLSYFDSPFHWFTTCLLNMS